MTTASETTTTGPHHRHSTHAEASDDVEQQERSHPGTTTESSPLVGQPKRHWVHHLSMLEGDDDNKTGRRVLPLSDLCVVGSIFCFFVLVLTVWRLFAYVLPANGNHQHTSILPVERAVEHWIDLDTDATPKTQLWFRTWGNPQGIPVLFVHGGPGNAIADYFGNSNQRFFDKSVFYVVEVDQRGTGNSQPSVRDDWRNMKYYKDISIDMMVNDFELVRNYLGIDQWLVWGGSFGSTLSINYGERYPQSCLALILRGIYLDTAEEVETVYSRVTYEDNPKRLHEFDILYNYAAQYVHDNRQKSLDPNDAERLMRVYADMITSGDRHAIWHWFVFENNLMELDPQYILDPHQIDYDFYPEALSIAFFETRLWIHGSYEEPTSNLLREDKIDNLTMPLWICQGQRDEVCPPTYARRFVDAVEEAGMSQRVVSRFLNATHEDTDPALEECLKFSLQEFVDVGLW